MKYSSVCRQCSRRFTHEYRGRQLLVCGPCQKLIRKANQAKWYANVRKDNPIWKEKNKKIAERWRKQNAEWIREYDRHRQRDGRAA